MLLSDYSSGCDRPAVAAAELAADCMRSFGFRRRRILWPEGVRTLRDGSNPAYVRYGAVFSPYVDYGTADGVPDRLSQGSSGEGGPDLQD